ncbi:MAG TPA: 4-alpha-glucanotransferase [Gammaproteobacteria bacterium]|nr:4-alpha-glucanotransferase [Gammaproteobacteria bacterium]
MSECSLAELATALGIQVHWTDINGRKQTVSANSLRALVAALGYPGGTARQLVKSHKYVAQTHSTHTLPPLLTAVSGRPINLTEQHSVNHKPRTFRIELEDGSVVDGHLGKSGDALPAIRLPGYHRLHIGKETTVLALAPKHCYSIRDNAPARAKRWGLAAQVYALRRDGDGGIGDFGALLELTRTVGSAGADALAISPVHAMFSAALQRRSPYSPSSRRLLNILMIDPHECFSDAEISAAAGYAGLKAAKQLEAAPLIDWPAAAQRKLALLHQLYLHSKQGNAQLTAGFESFLAAGGQVLHQHARFEVLYARYQAMDREDWRTWRETNAVSSDETASSVSDEMRFHMFLQWLAARGLERAQRGARAAGMSVGLIGDLAVGSDPTGSDAWSMQDQMLDGVTIGAPPDSFNLEGQSWGLTAFSPLAMRAHGYRGFLEVLRAAMQHCGGVRIDHVMNLMRLWLVPRGAKPIDGAYITYPMQDLLRLVALESHRHRCLVIGEDLGVVPAGFRNQLQHAGILGLDILLFKRGKDGRRFLSSRQWRRNAVAMTTTHDLPTLSGWWRGGDINIRQRIGILDTGDARLERERRAFDRGALTHAIRAVLPGSNLTRESNADSFVESAIGFVGASRCELALLPLEDVFALDSQPNVPGTIDEYPNWRLRLPAPAPILLNSDSTRQRLHTLAAARTAS